jgi:hypothetical protein
MVAVGRPDSEDWAMQAVTTIGLDIAKSVFQIHGVDAEGNVVVRPKLKRRYIVASAEGIMASGHANRTQRPNTWLHRPSPAT